MPTGKASVKRQSRRQKHIAPIELVANAEGTATLIPASTLDFSTGGLRIQTSIRLSVGGIIHIQFDHDPTDRRQYRVAWTKAGNCPASAENGESFR